MISAVGYSENEFRLDDPGRLCRGRERWIEPWEMDEVPEGMFRGVISGAQFDDDSARDALRGVQHSGIQLVDVVSAILGDKRAIAFMEDGHPADMPEGAEHIEAYTGYRYGGTRQEALVRWTMEVQGHDAIAALLGDDPSADLVRGFVVPHDDAELDELRELLFLLTGMSTLDSPPARYQPAAIPEILEQAELLVLLHRDKHGPAVGIYADDAVDLDALLRPLAAPVGALVVPFAIPPMLARWDRALAELRNHWDEQADGPFPVPEAPEGASWEGRRRRRRRKRKDEVDGDEGVDELSDDLDDDLIEEEDDDDGVLELGDDEGVLQIGD